MVKAAEDDLRPPGALLRAARAAADLSVQALAKRSGVGVNTLRRAEVDGASRLNGSTWRALLASYRALGVTFICEGASVTGLCWAPPGAAPSRAESDDRVS